MALALSATADRIELPALHRGQRAAYGLLRGRRTVLRCGRRWGKTTLLEAAAATRALRGAKVGWFAPEHKYLVPSFERLRFLLRPAVASSNKPEGLIRLETGGLIEFWNLSNEDAGRSRDYDFVVVDEASLVRGLEAIFDRAIAPTMWDRGGQAVMGGTPKGIDPENFFYLACSQPEKGWAEYHAPTPDNPNLNHEELALERERTAPLVYQQEFLAEFVDWSGAAFFSRDAMYRDGKPAEWPVKCEFVFATIDTAIKAGREHDGSAVIYWARDQFAPTKLTLLDYDIVQIEGGSLTTWLPGVEATLQSYAVRCGALHGSLGAFIEDKNSGTILLQHARKNRMAAHEIDSKLTAMGKDERAISVSGYVFRGEVEMSRHAEDRMVTYKGQTMNHLYGQVFGYRVGVKDQADDLLDCFCYGVAIALGDSRGF